LNHYQLLKSYIKEFDYKDSVKHTRIYIFLKELISFVSDKTVDVSDLYNGIYLLELENKMGLKSYEKIIINN